VVVFVGLSGGKLLICLEFDQGSDIITIIGQCTLGASEQVLSELD